MTSSCSLLWSQHNKPISAPRTISPVLIKYGKFAWGLTQSALHLTDKWWGKWEKNIPKFDQELKKIFYSSAKILKSRIFLGGEHLNFLSIIYQTSILQFNQKRMTDWLITACDQECISTFSLSQTLQGWNIGESLKGIQIVWQQLLIMNAWRLKMEIKFRQERPLLECVFA